MKKKLALLLFKYFPYGGLQKDFLGVANELILRGHVLKAFTRSWEGPIPEGLDVVVLGERGKFNYAKNRNFVKDVHLSMQDFSPDIIFGNIQNLCGNVQQHVKKIPRDFQKL